MTNPDELRRRVADYLAAHHTMTVATVGPSRSVARGHETPYAASVFYAADSSLGLVFLSKPSSMHGRNIGSGGPVAVTVTKEYDDWCAAVGRSGPLGRRCQGQGSRSVCSQVSLCWRDAETPQE
jgi:hypothetical protein